MDRHKKNNVLIQLSNTTLRAFENEALTNNKSIQAVIRTILNKHAKDLALENDKASKF